MDVAIQRLKFAGELVWARMLGELAARTWGVSGGPLQECLLPMPLHATRLRARGYNQALEIARPLARRIGVRLETRRCARVRPTAAQSGLDAAARRSNLEGAFRCAPGWGPCNVGVLDDVVTTGATVTALAHALRRAGVVDIDVWVIARSI